MSKITENQKLIAQLCSLQMHLVGRVAALEAACAYLWKESGRNPDDLMKFFSQEAEQENERFLLKIGDAHPELAKIADILKQLGKDQET